MLPKMETALTTEVRFLIRDALYSNFFMFHLSRQNRNGWAGLGQYSPTEVQSRLLSRTNRICSYIHLTGIISASTSPPVR